MEITQTNINEFYSFVQDQLTKITTKDGLDINIIVKFVYMGVFSQKVKPS